MTCGVCCEPFNKTNHKKVCCPFCDFESCRTCCQTYLLSTSEDPHCMSCKKVHNREFVDMFCTKRFRNNEYKKQQDVFYKDFEVDISGIKYYHGNVIIKVDDGWDASSITSSASNFDSNYYHHISFISIIVVVVIIILSVGIILILLLFLSWYYYR